jgi:hypothetical protein
MRMGSEDGVRKQRINKCNVKWTVGKKIRYHSSNHEKT